MENIFTQIYEKNEWGNNQNKEYSGSSGGGSTIEFNINFIPLLKNIIINNNIKNIVDLGCGDFRIGKLVYDDLNVIYTGYDTYKKVIDYNTTQHPTPKYNFKLLDFYTYKESIVEGDMCILKDVIQHWSLEAINVFLDYLIKSKKFKYILLINCSHQTVDNPSCETGGWRPLSCNFLPLKKYNPFILGYYHTKEISIIQC